MTHYRKVTARPQQFSYPLPEPPRPGDGAEEAPRWPTDEELTATLLAAGFTHCFGMPYRRRG